jgi:hypothetical protein
LKATPWAPISRTVPPAGALAPADAGAEAGADPLGGAAEPLAMTLGIGVGDGAGA